eukprot:3452031-Pleurochrysis_carterae.AAC.1
MAACSAISASDSGGRAATRSLSVSTSLDAAPPLTSAVLSACSTARSSRGVRPPVPMAWNDACGSRRMSSAGDSSRRSSARERTRRSSASASLVLSADVLEVPGDADDGDAGAPEGESEDESEGDEGGGREPRTPSSSRAMGLWVATWRRERL